MREWLKILGLVLLATLGLLLVQVMYDDFRRLRDLGARGLDIWMYFFVKMPSFLGLLLPMALLISLLFALGQLHRANELTAMRAAGVGFMRLMRPVWMVGVLCCALSWWLAATVIPWSVETARALDQNFQFRSQASLPPELRGAVNSVAFDNSQAGRMWFFNRYSRYTRKAYGTSVSVLDHARHETTRLLAAEARRDDEHGGWIFSRGRELTFSPETGELMKSEPFAEQHRSDFNEDPDLMLLVGRPPSDLSFFELRRLVDYLERVQNPKAVRYAVRYFSLLAATFSPLIVIAIAIPFAITGVRVNPAVGVSKSIGLFFLYYILDNIASSLATKQLIAPEFAAWLPNSVLALIALWLFARLR